MKLIFVKLSSIAFHILLIGILLTASLAQAQEAAGTHFGENDMDWGGLLAGQLHIVIHVTKNANDHYDIEFRSPDQRDFVLPTESVEVMPDHLGFSIPKIGGSYAGTWNAAQKTWVGAWTQGQSLPLILSRLDDRALSAFLKPKRPQEEAIAAAPRPYHRHEVTFENLSAKVKLAGTLSVPDGAGPFPGVIPISGSGPQARDEELFGHKIFLVLADALNRHGVAVLRYDKRGVGASTGNFGTATSVDFASDADAAVAFLKTRAEVDPGHIGLIGHSEGGAVAPSVAVRNPAVAFTVLMAGPGMRTDRLTVLQEALIAKAQGVPANLIARRMAFNEKLFAGLMTAKTGDKAMSIARASVAQAVDDKVLPADAANGTVKQVTSPWFRQALSYHPVPTLRKVRTPVLVLNGSLDLQIPSKENLALMREALKDNRGATVQELPNLNHLFQTAKTGSPVEYGQIEETIAPAVLQLIVDWIGSR
jgi:pimeloyl-ACP methyl ester carboxylesterase